MEIKKFSLYTEEERENLLMHWWHYYGKMIVTLAEMEEFHELVKKDSMLMRDVAILSFVFGQSSQGLIRAMRYGDLDNYLEGIKKIASSTDYKKMEEEIERDFLEEIVGTYNNPEPDVLMTEEQIVEGLQELVGTDVGKFTVVEINGNSVKKNNDSVLTVDKVHEVFRKCLVTDQEVNGNEPTVDFIIGEGIQSLALFSSERLEEYKDEIITLVDELPKLDEGVSFLEMCEDKNGRLWTGEQTTMDLLVQLGIASGVMSYILPRSDWSNLPGGMPYLIRNRDKDNEKVLGKKPNEYKRIIEDLKERLSK